MTRLFVDFAGFFGVAGMGRVQPKVPMKAYGILVTMYFAVSVVNNYALNFDIPMPLHMIFRVDGGLYTQCCRHLISSAI